ncbi:MAG: hypothetical protein IJS65_08050 [Clostridia bacterium]|nr:hypothetical protein [Clostridia bacterium]
MKKNVSLLLKAAAVLLILCFALPFPSAANGADEAPEEPPFINGLVHVNKATRPAKHAAPSLRGGEKRDLPEKYRSDEQPWAEGIQVKNQGQTTLCWAFSVTTAAEYSYAKELYELTGKTGAAPELSPAHLAQFYYSKGNDPLGNTGGDRNNCSDSHWTQAGGNQIYVNQYLSSRSGLGLEMNTPFAEVNDRLTVKNARTVWTGDGPYAYDDFYAYESALSLEESITCFCPGVDAVKGLILDYGAVSAAAEFDVNRYMNLSEKDPSDPDKGYKYGRSFYCFNKNYSPDHAVTIVGWDDAYPKERFTHKINGMADEQAFALTTPSADGAWVVQNSWGNSAHDGGFYYASYESFDLCGASSDFYAYNLQPSDTYIYYFGYDGTADCGDTTDSGNEAFFTASGTRAANVFRNTTGRRISVDAVNYITYSADPTESRVKIYKGLSDISDPESGVLLSDTAAVSDTLGTKTVVLDAPVEVAPEESFSVVFEFMTDNAFGVEKQRNYLFTVETAPGQSFFRGAEEGDTWVDMNDYNACFRIKALANPVDTYVSGNLNADGTVYVTVKNAIDHALLLAARKQNGKLTGARVLPVSEALSEEVFIPGEGFDITLALIDGETLAPLCEARKLASQ